MLTISAAFAGPLLLITNRQSFGIHLSGPSRTGKSVATLVGASVIGIGRVSDLPNWNVTDAGLEERLPGFNDAMFPIDDLENLKGNSDKEKYSRIRTLAYNISQGRPTARHSSFERNQERNQSGWRVIVISSAEKSIQDLARLAKLERQSGEAIRLIDVPVLSNGEGHIFDLAPVEQGTGHFQDWRSEEFKKLTSYCEKNHGAPFRKYVGALISDQDELRSYVEGKIRSFAKRVCDEFDGDLARDVAEKFGLIYAGGGLGIRQGLLPWSRQELFDAIAKLYAAARNLLPDDGVLLRKGIAALHTRLRMLPRQTAVTKFERIDGYRVRGKRKQRYRIKRDSFNALFSSVAQRDLVVAWLIKCQLVTAAAPKNATPAGEFRPQEQFNWPDGERRRSLEISWPRSRCTRRHNKSKKARRVSK